VVLERVQYNSEQNKSPATFAAFAAFAAFGAWPERNAAGLTRLFYHAGPVASRHVAGPFCLRRNR
jgi:hypothetical protein